MTADQHLTWTGDPTILVYAVRGILGHSGSHAPTLIADTIIGNRQAAHRRRPPRHRPRRHGVARRARH